MDYVLVTPARNEARTLEATIRSVVGQTMLPRIWVIVSDGSTDGTDDIVKRYLPDHPWMELVRIPDRKERHFAGKVQAFNAGYARVRDLSFDIIGSLDADITFDQDYFEFLMGRFADHPDLGVGGTPFREGNVQYNYRFSRKEHVSGACQLFRRKCFEEIGGYRPLKSGAVDLAAVVTARMKGWRTETFPERYCIHHRPMGSARDHRVAAFFKSGFGDYRMGVHPLWQLLRSFYQMTRKPCVVGGAMLLAGYLWAAATRAEQPMSREFVVFRRREQMQWLKDYVRRSFHLIHLPDRQSL